MRKSSRTVLGLDLGRHAVKAVLGTANASRLRILKMETLPLPADIPDPGKVIRKWCEEQDLGAVPTVVAIGGSRVMYQTLVMDADDPRRPDQVANIEAIRFSEMTDARMVNTATPASAEPGERRLLISLVRPDLLDQALIPVVEAGVKLLNVLPTPVALYNGVTALGEPVHQLSMFVDLGATHTEVAVVDGRGIRFARSFAMGTAQLTQTVATQGKLPLQQAERVRLQSKSFEELPGEAPRACEQFVQRWTRELVSCLQMFQNAPGGKEEDRDVKRILLSGGGSLWAPLYEALKGASPKTLSRVGRVAEHEHEESACFMIAAGLAADALGISRAQANLLPEVYRALLVRERNKRHWLVAGIFSVASMGLVAVGTQLALARENEQLNRHNNMLQRGTVLRGEIEGVEARMKLMDEMTAPLIRFVSNSARIRDLTVTISQEKGEQDFITFIGDSESYLELRVLAEENRALQEGARRAPQRQRQVNPVRVEGLRTARMNRLIVEGFTARADLVTVRALIEALRAHPDVHWADLLTDDFVFGDLDLDEVWVATGNQRFVLDVELMDVLPDTLATSPGSGGAASGRERGREAPARAGRAAAGGQAPRGVRGGAQ